MSTSYCNQTGQLIYFVVYQRSTTKDWRRHVRVYRQTLYADLNHQAALESRPRSIFWRSRCLQIRFHCFMYVVNAPFLNQLVTCDAGMNCNGRRSVKGCKPTARYNDTRQTPIRSTPTLHSRAMYILSSESIPHRQGLTPNWRGWPGGSIAPAFGPRGDKSAKRTFYINCTVLV